jgi:hypothetical protein
VQVLLKDQFRLLKELKAFSACLRNSTVLVLKQKEGSLECQFVKRGLICHVLQVRSKVLAEALQQLNAQGIVKGASFNALQYSFGNFSLHVKAKQLYAELCDSKPAYAPEAAQLAVA